ncbi:binding protein [Corchorus olitorius]|uniref:Binding protein n=1 Tax=Corchorus olitorius TaxID=93759 RepID=A0A1R3KEI1_9ROSI|nr:binding protein [Corchorus olitorius]
MQKDEEKLEVIRQLSLAGQVLKDENMELRKKYTVKESPKKWSPLEIQLNTRQRQARKELEYRKTRQYQGEATQIRSKLGETEHNSDLENNDRSFKSQRFASKVLVEMPKRDLVSWISFIDGRVKPWDLVLAHKLFDAMPQRNLVS